TVAVPVADDAHQSHLVPPRADLHTLETVPRAAVQVETPGTVACEEAGPTVRRPIPAAADQRQRPPAGAYALTVPEPAVALTSVPPEDSRRVDGQQVGVPVPVQVTGRHDRTHAAPAGSDADPGRERPLAGGRVAPHYARRVDREQVGATVAREVVGPDDDPHRGPSVADLAVPRELSRPRALVRAQGPVGHDGREIRPSVRRRVRVERGAARDLPPVAPQPERGAGPGPRRGRRGRPRTRL